MSPRPPRWNWEPRGPVVSGRPWTAAHGAPGWWRAQEAGTGGCRTRAPPPAPGFREGCSPPPPPSPSSRLRWVNGAKRLEGSGMRSWTTMTVLLGLTREAQGCPSPHPIRLPHHLKEQHSEGKEPPPLAGLTPWNLWAVLWRDRGTRARGGVPPAPPTNPGAR